MLSSTNGLCSAGELVLPQNQSRLTSGSPVEPPLFTESKNDWQLPDIRIPFIVILGLLFILGLRVSADESR
jgi:hypothetical protein